MILGALATWAAGLFAGAALYVSFVEHPARMECGSHLALLQWRPSYRRATGMQASLAVIGTLLGIAAWFGGGGLAWLVGALLLGAVIPFTLLAILPVNRRLLDTMRPTEGAQVDELLERWARLHAVRSALGLAAFVVFVVRLSERL